MPVSGATMARRATLAIAGACLLACDDGPGPVVDPPPAPPVISGVTVEAGPHNVLSAIVRASVEHADSVAVRIVASGVPGADTTPAIATAAAALPLELPVLGLRPATAYEFSVVAWGDADTSSAPVPFTTGALPADLPVYQAGGPSPSPGFVAFAVGTYALVIDDTGRVVWYRQLGEPTLNFQPLPTGGYATHPTNPAPGNLQAWTELDALGRVVRTYGCAGGLRSRFHDLIAEPDGSRWLLCDETRVMDLTAVGGDPAAAVTATVVQHVAADGTLRFQWNAFDHFALTDLAPALRTGPTVNFTHANALDFDGAGGLLLSFRSLSEVTCVDTATGQVRWRMGGLANQFTFDEAGTPFVRQHGARALPGGRVLLLDNLGEQVGSRAEQYALDPAARTARRERGIAAVPSAVAVLGGAVQALPDGHVLVAFGNGNRVQEYDAAGNVAWEIVGDAGYVYRATRITSLYRPGDGLIR